MRVAMKGDAATGGLRVALAALIAGTFAALGWGVLLRGHPHEDAYILFVYAENLARGAGVVFNRGGPPTEGATDFLWMASVAAGVRGLGLAPAVVALILNAAAVFGLALWLAATSGRGRIGALALAPWLVLAAPAAAAYVGFSTMAFGLGVVTLGELLRRGPAVPCWLVPLVGLACGLVRPEGVVVGVVATLAALPSARSAGRLPVYLGVGALAAALGAGYFLARYRYFGELLPLPLYVKGHRSDPGPIGLLPGLPRTWKWLRSPEGPLPPVAGLVVLVRLASDRTPRRRQALLALVPAAALVVALLFGEHIQNFAWRFQAPIALSLLLALASAAATALARDPVATDPGPVSGGRRVLVLVVVAAAIAPSAAAGVRRTLAQQQGERRYVDTFAHALGAILPPERTVVLTEAGRVPYWSEARMVDLVGLNNRDTARTPPTVAYVERQRPDVVFFHTSEAIEPRGFELPADTVLATLQPAQLRAGVRPAFTALYERGVESYERSGERPIRVAALTLARFLVEHPEYEIRAVRYGASLHHVWGIRRDLPERGRIVRALERTAVGGWYQGYVACASGGRRGRGPRTGAR